MPFRVANHLVQVIKNNFGDSEATKSLSMGRTKCTSVVKNVMGPYFKETLIEKLKSIKFSVMVDESTDISSEKAMCILVRYYYEEAGQILSRFLDLVNIYHKGDDRGATSENLFNLIMQTLEAYNIPKENIIGFASDGCNTMMGANNSVASRLSVALPGITILKCVCHSLHLCASEACKVLPQEVEDMVRAIYNYLNNSAKRQSVFQQFQKFMELKIHKMLHPSQTRWLSLIAAVERVLEQWDALKLFFTDAKFNDKSNAAEQIYFWLHNPYLKLYLLFLKYVLPKFTKLNEYFQTKCVLTSLDSKFKETYKELLFVFTDTSYKTRNIDKIDPNNSSHWKIDANLYLGTDIMIEIQTNKELTNEKNKEFFKNCRLFLIRAVEEIKKRYNFDNPTLSNLIHLRQSEALSLEYRDKVISILPLMISIPRIVESKNYQVIDDEWRNLPSVRNALALDRNEGDDLFWHKLLQLKNSLGEPMFKHLPKFALDAISLPHSNADCERIFSKINNVKTKSRNKLITGTVSSILSASEGLKNAGRLYNIRTIKKFTFTNDVFSSLPSS